MKKFIWLFWIILTIAVAGFYLYTILLSDDKQALLIGGASHGHFQIEMACDTCHTDAFGGKDALQEACVGCHEQELKAAHDSHPKKKFTDPRNADLLQVLDARYCVSCHSEHQKEQTRTMGVTLPDDYCFHCHQETIEERASHKDLPFDSCGSAGCHNFHDNRALYEDFLVANAGGSWLNDITRIAQANNAKLTAQPSQPHHALMFDEMAAGHPDIMQSWQHSSHAAADVNCGACHSDASQNWIAKPGIEQCSSCHKTETDTFLMGKHGMRLAEGLPAMHPEQSSLQFAATADAHNGCNSCHKPHEFDAQFAKTEACLGCHSDPHSLAFEDSPHGKLQQLANQGQLEQEQVVTCATCHMPRQETKTGGSAIISVNHNQNDTLRPNEKMIRPVCMQCHNLEFSIDALADRALIENNFPHAPTDHIPSIDWALKREKK